MPLLKNGKLIEDRWQHVAEGALIPVERPVIVPMRRLLGEDSEYLFNCGCCLGVSVEPEDRVEELASWVRRLNLIALRFPKFSDGRAYSAARVLRDRLGYKNELRATGEVLVDQYQLMRQCGFDSFEIAEGRAFDSWKSAHVDMSLTYQSLPTTGRAMSILNARHHARAAQAA